MSNPDPWPTEAAATAAVDALARKLHEAQTGSTDWAGLDPVVRTRLREAVLPTVWAVIEALPDPRADAWEVGASAIRNAHPSWWRKIPNPYRA